MLAVKRHVSPLHGHWEPGSTTLGISPKLGSSQGLPLGLRTPGGLLHSIRPWAVMPGRARTGAVSCPARVIWRLQLLLSKLRVTATRSESPQDSREMCQVPGTQVRYKNPKFSSAAESSIIATKCLLCSPHPPSPARILPLALLPQAWALLPHPCPWLVLLLCLHLVAGSSRATNLGPRILF